MIGVLMILGGYLWGEPILSRSYREGEVWQLQLCEEREGVRYGRCMPYGPPSADVVEACEGVNLRRANEHFPGAYSICSFVKWTDLDTPLGTKRRD